MCSRIFLFALLLPATAFAQEHTLRGIVRSRSDTAGVAGARVSIGGMHTATTTGANGEFFLRAVRGDSVRLVVTHPGINTMRRTVPTDMPAILFVEERAITLAPLSVSPMASPTPENGPYQRMPLVRSDIETFGDLMLGDVLRRLPGVAIGGDPGDENEVRLRGVGSEYTQVLFDGHRLPGSTDIRAYPINRVPAGLIDHVGIVHSVSAFLPSQAVAGSINLMTQNIPAKKTAVWEFGAGQSDGLESAPLTAALSGRFGEPVSGGGFTTGASAQLQGTARNSARVTHRAADNSDLTVAERTARTYKRLGATPKILMRAGDAHFLTVSGLLFHGSDALSLARDNTSSTGAPTVDHQLQDSHDNTWRVQTEYTGSTSRALSVLVGSQGFSSVRASRLTRRRGDLVTLISNDDEEHSETEWYAAAHVSWPLASHLLTAGTQLSLTNWSQSRTRLDTLRTRTLDRTNDHDVYKFGEREADMFIEDRFSLARGSMLVPGIRVEYLTSDARSRRQDDGRQNGVAAIPTLHYLMKLGRATNVRVAASRTTRRPGFTDMVPYVDMAAGTSIDPDHMGNPDLRPEHALGMELTLERYSKAGTQFSVNALARHITQSIQTILDRDSVTGRFIQSPFNAGTGNIAGIEVDGRATAQRIGVRSFSMNGSVAFYTSQLVTPLGERQTFNGQPRYMLKGGFDQRIQSIHSNVGMSFSRMPSTATLSVANSRRVSGIDDSGDFVDAYVSAAIRPGMIVRLSGHNVTGADRVRTQSAALLSGQPVWSNEERFATGRTLYLSLSSRH